LASSREACSTIRQQKQSAEENLLALRQDFESVKQELLTQTKLAQAAQAKLSVVHGDVENFESQLSQTIQEHQSRTGKLQKELLSARKDTADLRALLQSAAANEQNHLATITELSKLVCADDIYVCLCLCLCLRYMRAFFSSMLSEIAFAPSLSLSLTYTFALPYPTVLTFHTDTRSAISNCKSFSRTGCTVCSNTRQCVES
jgi:hypothetical protein